MDFFPIMKRKKWIRKVYLPVRRLIRTFVKAGGVQEVVTHNLSFHEKNKKPYDKNSMKYKVNDAVSVIDGEVVCDVKVMNGSVKIVDSIVNPSITNPESIKLIDMFGPISYTSTTSIEKVNNISHITPVVTGIATVSHSEKDQSESSDD